MAPAARKTKGPDVLNIVRNYGRPEHLTHGEVVLRQRLRVCCKTACASMRASIRAIPLHKLCPNPPRKWRKGQAKRCFAPWGKNAEGKPLPAPRGLLRGAINAQRLMVHNLQMPHLVRALPSDAALDRVEELEVLARKHHNFIQARQLIALASRLPSLRVLTLGWMRQESAVWERSHAAAQVLKGLHELSIAGPSPPVTMLSSCGAGLAKLAVPYGPGLAQALRDGQLDGLVSLHISDFGCAAAESAAELRCSLHSISARLQDLSIRCWDAAALRTAHAAIDAGLMALTSLDIAPQDECSQGWVAALPDPPLKLRELRLVQAESLSLGGLRDLERLRLQNCNAWNAVGTARVTSLELIGVTGAESMVQECAPRLRRLVMRTVRDMVELPRGMRHLQYLELDTGGSLKIGLPPEMTSLRTLLAAVPQQSLYNLPSTLEHLQVCGLVTLAGSSLLRLTNLTCLRVNNQIQRQLPLCKTLPRLQTLEFFYVRWNAVPVETAQWLARQPALTELRFTKTSAHVYEEAAEKAMSGLGLQRLQLSCCDVMPKWVSQLTALTALRAEDSYHLDQQLHTTHASWTQQLTEVDSKARRNV
jgi:hypothetical protein